MARRIRSIKPEFFTNEIIQALPVQTRYYLIGLWSYVDDYGRGSASPGLIRGQIDALADVSAADVDGVLLQLEEAGLIELYAVDKITYFQVADWDYWQKIDRPTKSRLPTPPDSRESLANPREDDASDSTDLDDVPDGDSWGKGERGGEREVEQESERERAAASLPPSPFCGLHPGGTDRPCRKCGTARKSFDYWQAMQIAQAQMTSEGDGCESE